MIQFELLVEAPFGQALYDATNACPVKLNQPGMKVPPPSHVCHKVWDGTNKESSDEIALAMLGQ